MKIIKSVTLLFLLVLFTVTESRGQYQEIVGGNLLNGAITGTMLGVATMGLANSDDFAHLRVGLGAGILGGAGMIAYDMTSRPRGGELFISGFFNDGRNSSVIILLDTVYGAAGGALIGMAGMLIADKPVAPGLQYGAGAGAWTGFAFGLMDAFYLSNRQTDMVSSLLDRNSLVELEHGDYRLDLFHPATHVVPEVGSYDVTRRAEVSLGVVSVRFTL